MGPDEGGAGGQPKRGIHRDRLERLFEASGYAAQRLAGAQSRQPASILKPGSDRVLEARN